MAENTSNKPSRDLEDIDLEEPKTGKQPRRGSGIVGWIILLVVIVLVALLYNHQKKVAEEAKKQAQIAEQARQAQFEAAKRNLQEAYNLAVAGNVDAAIDRLQVADAQLGNIVSAANAEKNTAAAEQALSQKKYIADALAALRAKKQELQELALQQFALLASQFGLQAPATGTSTGEATAPTETGATSASPEEAPAGTEAAPPPGTTPAETAPTAPSPASGGAAVPPTAAPQAPAAPSVPAPAAPPAGQ